MTQDGKIKKNQRGQFPEAYPKWSRVLKEESFTASLYYKYPAPLQGNLNAMITICAFGLTVDILIIAKELLFQHATLGLALSKSILLDKSLPGFDHKASLEPDELKNGRGNRDG